MSREDQLEKESVGMNTVILFSYLIKLTMLDPLVLIWEEGGEEKSNSSRLISRSREEGKDPESLESPSSNLDGIFLEHSDSNFQATETSFCLY